MTTVSSPWAANYERASVVSAVSEREKVSE